MGEQRYALYAEGKGAPVGVLRESTLGAVNEISQLTGQSYRTEPVSDERADEITKERTRLSPDIERLFSN